MFIRIVERPQHPSPVQPWSLKFLPWLIYELRQSYFCSPLVGAKLGRSNVNNRDYGRNSAGLKFVREVHGWSRQWRPEGQTAGTNCHMTASHKFRHAFLTAHSNIAHSWPFWKYPKCNYDIHHRTYNLPLCKMNRTTPKEQKHLN